MQAPICAPVFCVPADLKLKGFKAYKISNPKIGPSTFSRRDYYKIVLSIGKVVINYADSHLDLDGAYLFLANPHSSYSVDVQHETGESYGCSFTENFIRPQERTAVFRQSPLFNRSGMPAFQLDGPQQARVTHIFASMITEQATDYGFKDDLMRTYIQLLIHEALQLQPTEHFVTFTNASLRVTTQFLELLEQQFPVDSQAPLQLKTAQDYANRLSIHVNHLNRAVKKATGRSTTTLIAERVTTEATALLQHTDWSIADIAATLGFEYPNYFSNFFKKMTGNIPKAYRAR